MKIATVAVYVANQGEAVRFWTERVGFVIHREKTMTADMRWVEVGPRGAESCLVLYPRALMQDWAERKPSVVFECPDLAKAHGEMVARGVAFQQPPTPMPWGPFAIFLDPEGNWFGLRETPA